MCFYKICIIILNLTLFINFSNSYFVQGKEALVRYQIGQSLVYPPDKLSVCQQRQNKMKNQVV